jgi:hypothetical protein
VDPRTVSDTASEQEQLLQRIQASRHFAQSEMLKRILRYLVGHSQNPDSPALTEYAIATDAIGRPPPFDPQEDPIVRVSMHSIRQRLESYFETEGRTELWRLGIPKGRYRALFVPNERREEELAKKADSRKRVGPWVKRFWKPYFDNERPNILVHSEPLFLRDDRGTRIRDVRLNDPQTAPQRIKEIWPELEGWSLLPYYAYLSVGTVYCMLAVIRMFHEAGVAIEPKSPRACTWQELRRSNLVLIGSATANPYVDALEGGGSFVLREDSIACMDPQPGEQARYCDERYMDGKLAMRKEYALLTRRPGLAPGCAVTIMAAIHSKAIEAAGQFVTSEDQLCKLLESLSRHSAEVLPDHFQVVIEVDMIDAGDEVINVSARPKTHRVIPTGRQADSSHSS